MNTTFQDFDSRLPSGTLWRGFAPPTLLLPGGSSAPDQSGNPSFGFFDNFFTVPTTTLLSPYLKLASAGCTLEQIVDTATEKGIIQFSNDGTANDEVVLQWGRGIAAPFEFNVAKDLVFECRFAVSAITAAKWSIFAGLALADCGAQSALAHHHGTFQLTDEAIDAPVIALGEALDEAKIARDRFAALKPGQVVEI